MSPTLRCTWTACLLLFVPLSASGQVQSFDSNGVKIAYTVEGQGEPVVLIHGFTSDGDRLWKQTGIHAALVKDYKVIALDCRGHGQSGKPHDPKQYGAQMAEDIVRLLDHLGIKKAHVVGYSMGAYITLKLITLHPDRVLSATLGGAGWARPQDEVLREELAESLEKKQSFAPLIRRLTPKGQEPPTAEQIQFIDKALAANNDLQALAAVARGFTGLSVPAGQLKEIKVPTVAIVGELDPLKEGVQALKEHRPATQVIVLEGADHVTAFQKPEFTQQLRSWLGKNRQQ